MIYRAVIKSSQGLSIFRGFHGIFPYFFFSSLIKYCKIKLVKRNWRRFLKGFGPIITFELLSAITYHNLFWYLTAVTTCFLEMKSALPDNKSVFDQFRIELEWKFSEIWQQMKYLRIKFLDIPQCRSFVVKLIDTSMTFHTLCL